MFKESPRITNLVSLCFFVRVGPVKGSNHTAQFEAYPRPIAFNGLGTSCAKKRLDTRPRIFG
ncbi:hypothetical protein D3C72_2490770 [compost metagenome]